MSCLHRGICDDLIFINVIHFIMSLSFECQHDFSAVCHGNLTRRQFITICTDVFWDTCQVFFCSIATKASGVLLKQLITTDTMPCEGVLTWLVLKMPHKKKHK